MIEIGDKHNFGKAVKIDQEYVFKPRTIYWESLFLSKSSAIRYLIEELHADSGKISPFLNAPELEVIETSWFSGQVETLKLEEIAHQYKMSRNQLSSVGAMMAMVLWFGIGDLHGENMAIGTVENKLVCFPIDIECLLDHFTHIKQSLLLPSKEISEDKCGLGKILKFLRVSTFEDQLILLSGFVGTLNILNRNRHRIRQQLVADKRLSNRPLRVVIRDTRYYLNNLKMERPKSLYASEYEQLNRGDIPFYFRFPNKKEILYLKTPTKVKEADFKYEELDISSPIMIYGKEGIIKSKSAILSLNYIAKILDINSSMKTLNYVCLSRGKTNIEFKMNGDEILTLCN